MPRPGWPISLPMDGICAMSTEVLERPAKVKPESPVEVIKKAVPAIDEAVSGAILALFCSTILYILTAITQLPLTPDQALQCFAAWLGVTATAIGVKATTEHISGGGS